MPFDTQRNNNLVSFLRQARFIAALKALVQGCVKAWPFYCLSFLIFSFVDHEIGLPLHLRQILWCLIVFIGVLLLLSGFYPFQSFSINSFSRNISIQFHKKIMSPMNLQRLRVDDLSIAYHFLQIGISSGVSEQLKNEMVLQTEEKLKQSSPSWCFPFQITTRALIVFVGITFLTGSLKAMFSSHIPLNSRITFPFGGLNFEEYFRIEPGDTFVPWGATVALKLISKKEILEKPIIYIKSGSTWRSLNSNLDDDNTQIYEVKNIIEPVSYRFKWKNDWSRKYTLTPQKLLEITKFDLFIRPPDYTGSEGFHQTSPDINALPGTDVSITGWTSTVVKKVHLSFRSGENVDVQIDKNKLSAAFKVESNNGYRFILTTERGDVVEDQERLIQLTVDQPPTVELISPAENLTIGNRETLPLTFKIGDDYGISKALLVFELFGGKTQEILLGHSEMSGSDRLHSFDWDLSPYNWNPGQQVRFKLKVFDNNVVTGSGQAETVWRILEVKKFEEEHAQIEKALETWRDNAVDLLAQLNTMTGRMESANPEWPALQQEFQKSMMASQELENQMSRIVSKMEEDPLADYQVWLEHEAIRDNLRTLNQTAMKLTQSAMQTQNKHISEDGLEQMSSEMERMIALSEELSKNQKAKDVISSAESLEKLSENLMENLADSSFSDEQINKFLNEAQEILSEIASLMQSGNKDLPDDFINQESMKEIDIKKNQDILSQISQAMKSGNKDLARKLAQEFLEAVKKMKSQLEEAHESFMELNSASQLDEELRKQNERLEKVISEQRAILSETQKLDSKRLERLLRSQEDLISELLEDQKKVINRISQLLGGNQLVELARRILTQQLPSMEQVKNELERKKIGEAANLLKGIIDQLQKEENEIQKTNPSADSLSPLQWARLQEEGILSKIITPPFKTDTVPDKEKSEFSSLRDRQNKLAEETGQIKKEIQSLSRKTANLGLSLNQSLKKAGDEMMESQEALQKILSQKAQMHEERTLDALSSAQNELQNAQDAMSSMSGSGGSGSSGGMKVMARPMGSSSSGSRVGPVKLPRAEDYRPPKEFREDLLEALKEKYPKVYEDIIHKYYKRLTE
jgi:hypothetical protein